MAHLPTEEIAAEHGVTPATVLNWKAAGLPHVPMSGREFYFDPEVVRRWRAERPGLGTPGRPNTLINGRPAAELLAEVKIRKELALAERHEHNLERLKREVVPIEEVRNGNLQRIAEARANLLALPGKLAGRLVGMDERRIYQELDESVREILARFAQAGDELLNKTEGTAVDKAVGEQVVVA